MHKHEMPMKDFVEKFGAVALRGRLVRSMGKVGYVGTKDIKDAIEPAPSGLTAPETQSLRRYCFLDTPISELFRWGYQAGTMVLPEYKPQVGDLVRRHPQDKAMKMTFGLVREPITGTSDRGWHVVNIIDGHTERWWKSSVDILEVIPAEEMLHRAEALAEWLVDEIPLPRLGDRSRLRDQVAGHIQNRLSDGANPQVLARALWATAQQLKKALNPASVGEAVTC